MGDEPEEVNGVGVAHFFRTPEARDVAEVAIAVIDDKQGLGLGRILAGALAQAAHERGIRKFRANVLRANEPARALIEDLSDHFTLREESDCVVYEIALPDNLDAELPLSPLYRFLKLAAQGVEFVVRHLTAAG